MAFNKDMEQLDTLLTFEFAGKEFKGISCPIGHLDFEYNDDNKLTKTIDCYMEEVPIINEYFYDDNGNCNMVKSYKSGLVKPKESDISVSISKYDDQNRLTYANTPISERTIEYLDGDVMAVKEKDKMNNILKSTMVDKDGTVIHQLTVKDDVEQSELYRDYDSELAKKYGGFDEVIVETIDGVPTVMSRTTFNKDNYAVVINSMADYGIYYRLEKEYDENHPGKIIKETAYRNKIVVDEVNYEHNFETDEYTAIGKTKKIKRSKMNGYYKVEYFDPHLKNELTAKIMQFNDCAISLFYNPDGEIFSVEFVDNKNDYAFAYNIGEDKLFYMMDADVRIGDKLYKFIKDNSPTGYRFIYQEYNKDNLIVAQDDIAANSDGLIEFMNSKVIEFIKGNELLNKIITEEGGLDVEKQFVCQTGNNTQGDPLIG